MGTQGECGQLMNFEVRKMIKEDIVNLTSRELGDMDTFTEETEK